MKPWKLIFTAMIASAAFAGAAQAYTTVTINDTYIGGNPAGGTNSNTSWDGKDVVGDAAYFGINKMAVDFNGRALDRVRINTNYVDYLGKYDTHMGDLFISTNGYTAAGIYDTNTTGEQWEYALVLNACSEVHSKDFRGTSGTLGLYNVYNSGANNNIVLSHANGTYRNYQEVEINTRYGQIAQNAGTWSINKDTNELIFDLSTNFFDNFNNFGFHWGESCGNDVIEGGASAPVPEPSTFALLGAGLLGAGLIRRKMKK
ncbi:PEP-CTERM motif protein [Geobacter sp. OR-1]|uniref:PEP-CTERM sorting domain-containing protein n=1 Tax=Geobacter sp. OR-1 TaxID=1266765 RepID=UPI0005426013|nr:PEP-CTERM sorting domain-containing protein [Geobacter sp. OR-1]GAM09369.1 PEP-CTERM motif protein [Geobacter sp. OR-1]